MSFSLVILLLVFLGIAIRQFFRVRIKIYQIMSLGALTAVLTGQISLHSAWMAIDWSILFFLFGMFILGQALEQGGLLSILVEKLFLSTCSLRKLVAIIVFGTGLFSALFMNDTLAIIGTPLLLKVAHYRRMNPQPLLLGLAFSITVGSIMSPIGNPQNLFIALQTPIDHPFIVFFQSLALPTLINLILLYFMTVYLARNAKQQITKPLVSTRYDTRLVYCSKIALALVFASLLYNITASLLSFPSLPLPWIALVPAFFLLFFTPRRKNLLTHLDWGTLMFFIAMFVLMRSVWETSEIKDWVLQAPPSTLGILGLSVIASQFISNVPLVALYLPILKAQTHTLLPFMALSAGSTLAGNFFLFGAASNVIILQNAEKRGSCGIPFWRFSLYGIPFTLVNLAIFWAYLAYQ